MAVKAVFLVLYLIGAICTAWCLGAPIVSGKWSWFLRVSFVIWTFTMTVFGVLVLLGLALALTGREADFQQSPAAAVTSDAGNDSQATEGAQARMRSGLGAKLAGLAGFSSRAFGAIFKIPPHKHVGRVN
jgi:hypothetical protein